MEANKFWELVRECFTLPFGMENVNQIQSNCNSTWIELKESNSYFINAELCEQEEHV